MFLGSKALNAELVLSRHDLMNRERRLLAQRISNNERVG